jgi:catechol 2,3-dioxygenase-like lactoylglutathione lyase family enzyme
MMGSQPVFDQVNLVVSDMDATLEFYRALGLRFAEKAGAV